MRMVRSLYARSKLEKYHESTNVYRQKIYFPKAKVRQWAKSRQKRSFKGWFAEFVLTRKKVCAHDKKGFTSREKRFHLTSANSPLGFSPVHWLCSCARFRDFCLFNPSLGCFERPTLRGCFRREACGSEHVWKLGWVCSGYFRREVYENRRSVLAIKSFVL